MPLYFNSTKVQFGASSKVRVTNKDFYFNSTKVQFGVRMVIAELLEGLHFNSTKVQFGEFNKRTENQL